MDEKEIEKIGDVIQERIDKDFELVYQNRRDLYLIKEKETDVIRFKIESIDFVVEIFKNTLTVSLSGSIAILALPLVNTSLALLICEILLVVSALGVPAAIWYRKQIQNEYRDKVNEIVAEIWAV